MTPPPSPPPSLGKNLSPPPENRNQLAAIKTIPPARAPQSNEHSSKYLLLLPRRKKSSCVIGAPRSFFDCSRARLGSFFSYFPPRAYIPHRRGAISRAFSIWLSKRLCFFPSFFFSSTENEDWYIRSEPASQSPPLSVYYFITGRAGASLDVTR